MTNLIYDDEIEFDINPFLLGFNSKVYDLQEGALRDYRSDDYVSMTVSYNIEREIEKRDKEKDEELLNIIKDIAGEQAPFLLKLFARTLFGKAFEKFTILRGDGRNGKSLILELIYKTLGQYAYRAPVELVTNLSPKSGELVLVLRLL